MWMWMWMWIEIGWQRVCVRRTVVALVVLNEQQLRMPVELALEETERHAEAFGLELEQIPTRQRSAEPVSWCPLWLQVWM